MSRTTIDKQSAWSADTSVQQPPHTQAISKARLWTGRALTGLTTLFLLFDAVEKFLMPLPVVQASQRLALPMALGGSIGILLTVCTLLYAIPRTSVLGAVLLTGYLGGAVAIQMRAGSSLFETIFPVLFGVVVWAGIILRERRLIAVFPIRRARFQ